MKFVRSMFIILLSFILIEGALCAQESTTVTYDEYMNYVEENAPDLMSEQLGVDISGTDVKSAKGAGDITFSGGASLYQTESLTADQTTNGVKGNGGLSKTFLNTGTNVYGDLSYDKYTTDAAGTSTDGYSPALTLGVRQPLLYNFLGAVDKSTLKTAEMQYEIDKAQYDITKTSLMNAYRKLYIEWVAYKEIVKNNEKNIKNALANYNQVLRKKKKRLAENDDVQEAYSAVLSYRQSYNQNLITLNNLEKQVLTALKMEKVKPDSGAFSDEYGKIKNLNIEYIAFEDSKNYQILSQQLSMYKFERSVAENEALPELDLFGELTQKGASETFGDSFGEMNKTDYEIGVEITAPLGSTTAVAASEKAALQLKQMEYSLQSSIQTYENDIHYLIDSADKIKKIIGYTRQNISSLKSKLATEQRQYNQARTTLSTLIDTRNSIATKEVSLIQYQLQLIEIYYDYDELTK